MTNSPFKPAPSDHNIEVLIDGHTHKGQYHLERENIVVSYQGASKMVAAGADNDALAREVLAGIVAAKHGRH